MLNSKIDSTHGFSVIIILLMNKNSHGGNENDK
jgi:hypothetical protein